ncbi:MAG: glycosyltransferase N-terminal domain-containing protein, partial [Pseudomonadota bacterium]
MALDLPARPAGQLIWLHGASLGESRLLLRMADALGRDRPETQFLFTSQTTTSADMVGRNAKKVARHQMAPVDTPAAVSRFIDHWQPDLGIFAEGEIWPNLIMAAKAAGTPLVLVNARMTEGSIRGWQSWPTTARELFGAFDRILPADTRTADAVSALTGQDIKAFGNLKVSGSPKTNDHERSKPILLGASTHDGEEALLLEALSHLGDGWQLILAPRHPDRGEAVARTVAACGHAV